MPSRNIEQEHSETLLQTNNSHKWWSTLKGAVFGARSSIPPLVGNGGVLVSDSVGQAELFMRHFDEKQSRDRVPIPQGCSPEDKFSRFAFHSGELRKNSVKLRFLWRYGSNLVCFLWC